MKGGTMADKWRNTKELGEIIKIPQEYIEKIDKIVNTGMSVYPSREEFIKSAVEIKLAEIRNNSSRIKGLGSK